MRLPLWVRSKVSEEIESSRTKRGRLGGGLTRYTRSKVGPRVWRKAFRSAWRFSLGRWKEGWIGLSQRRGLDNFVSLNIIKISTQHVPAKTAPFCCRSNWWLAVKINGIELKVRYRTAQLNDTQSEKKKTTGSVARRSNLCQHDEDIALDIALTKWSI